MFRLFLMNKLPASQEAQLPRKQYRNRRLYERFQIDHKHIALLNQQDILMIRDLSESGLCCEVDDRCLERLEIGDRYTCRMRYANEIYEVTVRVAWKKKPFVGFALEEPSQKVTQFIERIITPARIGYSLKTLDHSLRKLVFDGLPLEFHGEDQTQILIWEAENKLLESWYFEFKDYYIKWELHRGLETGRLLEKRAKLLSKPWEKEKKRDMSLNARLTQFAMDVFMTLNFPRVDALIESLNSKSAAPVISISP